ncbi:MAG: preprotein translocase subunit SecG [Gammaproteobacteria bacterium]|nr:preprotein translocase subunit SecG [Gammaproteobacteria bacterium]NNJ48729.1 preprotein translocase subunit SecG [Gammaproteobacteria bacterium]
MDIILLVLHVVLSLGIITLVLLQKGAGASAGAAFGGGGGAGSVFGATGSSNFLSKTTAVFAIGFFVNSLVLAYLAANREVQSDSVLDALVEQPAAIEETIEVPVADDVPAPEAIVPAESGEAASDAVPPADVPPAAGE